MAPPNGKDIRAGIAAEIFPSITAVADGDKLTYLPSSFNSHSPMVCLGKEEDERPPLTNMGDKVTFYVPVWLLSLYSDPNGTVYDVQVAHDLLSDIRAQLAAGVTAKRKVLNKWQCITQDGRSQVLQPFPVAGDTYILEIVILKVEVY